MTGFAKEVGQKKTFILTKLLNSNSFLVYKVVFISLKPGFVSVFG